MGTLAALCMGVADSGMIACTRYCGLVGRYRSSRGSFNCTSRVSETEGLQCSQVSRAVAGCPLHNLSTENARRRGHMPHLMRKLHGSGLALILGHRVKCATDVGHRIKEVQLSIQER